MTAMIEIFGTESSFVFGFLNFLPTKRLPLCCLRRRNGETANLSCHRCFGKDQANENESNRQLRTLGRLVGWSSFALSLQTDSVHLASQGREGKGDAISILFL